MKRREKIAGRVRISGTDLREMLAVGTMLLQENVEMVNGLNVFPVPDGDTGTNMLLTMQSALEEVSKLEGNEFGAVAHAAAHGSLMGARGNSGVILSQILRGLARCADNRESLNAAELALALREGATIAYRGIGKPVEGTILTVARESAEAAVAAAEGEEDALVILRATVEAGRISLANTPNLLPILREAGVVDAGGQGYLLLLEGALMFVSGERKLGAGAFAGRIVASPVNTTQVAVYGYCTEVLIRGENLQLGEIRDRLETLGNSVAIVGDPDLLHLHVHTQNPGDVLNMASALGTLERVKVENMQVQHTAYLSSRGSGDQAKREGIGVVVVAAGTGMAGVFKDLGASVVVHGGQTMNPSIEELVHGVGFTGFSKVILLPNNPNVILTAQQAKGLVRVELLVLPTRTVCEGVAAMVAFNGQIDLEANLSAMSEAASAVRSVEITRAVRSSKVNGLEISNGQAIGVLDGVLVAAGDSLEEVAREVLERAGAGEREVVTLYRGEGVLTEQAEALAESIRGLWPQLQVEVVSGGQPHYPYIISVE